jgi:hypothetical protein
MLNPITFLNLNNFFKVVKDEKKCKPTKKKKGKNNKKKLK